MNLTDEICDKLCMAARKKSNDIGIDISFAVYDENGLPRVYRRFGEALVLSITLVPGKTYNICRDTMQNKRLGCLRC